MSDNLDAVQHELFKQHVALKEKYAFFLMAVAGACIALCVKRTTGLTIQYRMILIAFAAICWGLSFYGGCRAVSSQVQSLFLNYELLKVVKGTHPLSGTDPRSIEIGTKEMTKIVNEKSDASLLWWKVQFLFLFLGALLFLAWHITDMALGGSSLPPEH